MSVDNTEKITIGIPVYNMEKSILQAVNSCLEQSYKNIEILIVDDGSADNSISIIKENIQDSRLRIYQRESNGGVCRAMIDLVNNAQGKYICFLDADDTMMPTRVEKQYEAIKSAERRFPDKIVASFCGSLVKDISSGTQYNINPNDLWNSFAEHSFGGGTGHSMYRVADLKRFGNFDLRFSRSADSAMCVTFLMNGGFYAMISEPLIVYNFCWDKNKKTVSKQEEKVFEILKQEIRAENPSNLYLQRLVGLGDVRKSWVKFLGLIPFLKILRKRNGRKICFYLFGIIPLLIIKNK